MVYLFVGNIGPRKKMQSSYVDLLCNKLDFMRCLLLMLIAGFSVGHAQEVKITAGNVPLETPIEIRLKKPLSANHRYALKDKSGKLVAAQLKDSVTIVFIPAKPIKPGTTVSYQLQKLTGKAASTVKLQRKENGYLVQIHGKPVFFYHVKTAMPPADSPAFYQRSGFIHPLYSPAGQIMTDDFPVAHIHQHAIFSAWTNTRFKGTAVDFWNQHNQTGTVEHKDIVNITEGAVFSEIITELNYKSFAHGVVLTEQWRLIIYPFKDYFLFDLESLQKNITTDTLFLNTYHYGGMAFRGSREWNPDDKKHFNGNWNILTSEGYKDSAANQTAARWVDASGKVNGKMAGVSVFNHPDNFRYPQKIRVHPQMPYWCYAPMIDGAFFIAPGKTYQARFRYYVHTGASESRELDLLHNQWTNNPQITVY